MNYFKTGLLMTGLMILVMFIGRIYGGTSGMVIAFIFAVITNLGMYWFSDKLVLTMYGAKPITREDAPQVYRALDELVQRSQLPMPKVYILDQETPNAFATGRNPSHAAVAVTHGIMRLLSYDEIKGVLAHELAHIKNRDMLISTLASVMAGVIMYLASMAKWAAIFGGFGGRDNERGGNNILGLLVAMIVAPLAATLIQMAISRSREYAADIRGAQFAGSPHGLAGALEKLDHASKVIPMEAQPATANLFIVNPLNGSGMMNLFSTHPPIQERVRRLREDFHQS